MSGGTPDSVGARPADRALSPSATAPEVAALPGNDPSRDADKEADEAARFGRRYMQIQAAEYGCSGIVCAFPHDGNCWCFNTALAEYLASGIETATAGETEGFDPKGESPTAQPGRPNSVASCNSHRELISALEEAKILIGARNDTVAAAVRESNINQAWHILDAALSKAKAKGEAL